MIRAVNEYAPSDRALEAQHAIAAAANWLRMTAPEDTEDRTFRLLGLHWAHAASDAIAEAGRDLLAQQRSDGGWAQISSQSSNAYATAESLVALREAGVVRGDAPEFGRGIDFLLGTQNEDGSWHLKSRAKPIQTYFETGFPFGTDQFISYAATCWATLAILRDGALDHLSPIDDHEGRLA